MMVLEEALRGVLQGNIDFAALYYFFTANPDYGGRLAGTVTVSPLQTGHLCAILTVSICPYGERCGRQGCRRIGSLVAFRRRCHLQGDAPIEARDFDRLRHDTMQSHGVGTILSNDGISTALGQRTLAQGGRIYKAIARGPRV
ncbi:hypothetical protein [Pyrobaculum sp.]|uniref:hypothetical protein n=1 Tax=Pyrobaculum sp. TaxID=2004705 RepID=UPI003178F4B5